MVKCTICGRTENQLIPHQDYDALEKVIYLLDQFLQVRHEKHGHLK